MTSKVDTTSTSSFSESSILSPSEFADKIVEHEVHPKIYHHPFVRFILILLIYVFAICGLSFMAYLGLERGKEFLRYHNELKTKLEVKLAQEKRISDVERTLSMAYEHLTVWEVKYYTNIMLDFSDKYDIPWEAYAALIRYESNWNPTLKSDLGAIGMTQVLEVTGKKVATDLGIRWRPGETLWNDLFNMVIGFTYFSESFTVAVAEGQTRSEALQHAMRHYVSGTGYLSKIKNRSQETQTYVQEYKTSIWRECKKLMVFYKAVQAGEPDSLMIEAFGN